MSQIELLNQIRTLEERLERQENIVKSKDALIKFLKDKWNDQQRKVDEVRKLALKIGNICAPTLGNSVEEEWDSIVDRATNGAPIFVASNILEPVSSNFKLSDETAGDKTEGENKPLSLDNAVVSEGDSLNIISMVTPKKQKASVEPRIEVESISMKAQAEKLNNRTNLNYKTRRKSREENKSINLSTERRSRSESFPVPPRKWELDAATIREISNPSTSKIRMKTMSDPAKGFFSNGRFKRGKKAKPPKLPEQIKFLQPGEDARSSGEFIEFPRSDRLSESCSPVPTMASDKPVVGMSIMSSAVSSKYQENHQGQPRSMSDRSLSSLAEVLPSLPSENSIIPLSSVHSRESNRRARGEGIRVYNNYKLGIDI